MLDSKASLSRAGSDLRSPSLRPQYCRGDKEIEKTFRACNSFIMVYNSDSEKNTVVKKNSVLCQYGQTFDIRSITK